MSSVPTTPSTLPHGAPPLPPLVANTHETDNVALATSNSAGGLNGAHRFVVVALSLHIVVDATRTIMVILVVIINVFSRFNNADP
jgi:hypothetical protein